MTIEAASAESAEERKLIQEYCAIDSRLSVGPNIEPTILHTV
jgi:hypothetical protein